MHQEPTLVLSGKPSQPRTTWYELDGLNAYSYLVMSVACYASYLGAPALLISGTGLLLALPNIVGSLGKHTALTESAVHLVVALIFAALAHIVGLGIAGVIGS